MILNKTPVSLSDVNEYKKKTKIEKPLSDYLRQFCKITKERADRIKNGIIALNNPKIGEGETVKIVDFLPKDQEELNKIFLENSLNVEEATAVLNIVKSD